MFSTTYTKSDNEDKVFLPWNLAFKDYITLDILYASINHNLELDALWHTILQLISSLEYPQLQRDLAGKTDDQ